MPAVPRERDRAPDADLSLYWLREYTLEVRSPADPRYVSPYDPGCRPTERYLAVHAPDGSWAIADRRTGKLHGRGEPGGAPHYTYRADVIRAVEALNRTGVAPVSLSQVGSAEPGGGAAAAKDGAAPSALHSRPLAGMR